jgi:membrane-bound lytic murein transglycosylase D
LLIPVEKVAVFKQNLATMPADEWVTWQRHKVKSGENLGVIARRYRTTVRGIRQVNKLPNNTIHAGRHLFIPVSSTSTSYSPTVTRHSYVNKKQLVYTVRPGDSYWKIARKHDVTGKQIAIWNKITLSQVLKPGQKLVIKNGHVGNTSKTSTSSRQLSHYTVRKGDSLFGISRKFNVSIANLRKWNAKTLGKHLHPGQKLIVKASLDQPAT